MKKYVNVNVRLLVEAPDEEAIEYGLNEMFYQFESMSDDFEILDTEIVDCEKDV